MKFEKTQVFNFEGAFRGMRNPKESYHLSDSEFGLAGVDDLPDVVEDCIHKHIDIKDFANDDTYNKFDKDIVINFNCEFEVGEFAAIGPADLRLAQTLIRAGSEHRKFMRQIFVSVDITAPLFWWKEFDTYKVGTVANSTSTMHKMASKPITIDCFEIDDYKPHLMIDNGTVGDILNDTINKLENLRQKHLQYLEWSKTAENAETAKQYALIAKEYWKELIRWLPESWLQTRTVTMTYENLYAMCSCGQRRFHKLNEWSGQDNNSLNSFIKWARSLPYAQELIFIDELKFDKD